MSSTVSPPAGPFGREVELARLVALYDAACGDGRGRAVLVTGPAGVGKSRLLDELRRTLRERGETPLEGACSSSDHRPQGLLLDLLGGAGRLMADLRRPAPRTERALGLLCGLRDDGAQAALPFYEAVRQALLEVSAAHPAVLFLHDLHRADEETLRLVRYLVANLLADPAFDWSADLPDLPAPGPPPFQGLLVLSFRETEAVRPLLEVARASAAVEHVPLRGLDAAGVRDWLGSDEFVERLMRASGGLPAALENLVDSLPEDASAVWPRRIAELPPEAQPVLDALAINARPATAEQVAALVEVSGDAHALLADLVSRKVLERRLETGVVRYRFTGSGARAAWLRTVPASRAQGIHRRIAERLAVATAMGAEPEEVAHHYLAGGAIAEAVPFARQAAERLERCFAYRRAARLLEAVVDATVGDLQAEILDRLARLYAETGDADGARACLARLVESFPERAGPALEARVAGLHLAAGDHAAARAVAEAALGAEPPPQTREELVAVAAEAAWLGGDLAAAEAHARGAADDGRPCSLGARNTLGKVHLAREELDEAQALFARNLEVAEAASAVGQQARALINLGVVDLQRGEPDAALHRFSAAHALATEAGELRLVALAVENLAVLHHRRQAYAEALVYHHQSTAAFRRLGHEAQLATTALNLADLYLTVGDAERARRLAQLAAEHQRRGDFRFLEAQTRMLEGDLARTEQDLERALERYEAAIGLIEAGRGANQRLGPLLWSKADVLAEAGDADAATAALEQASALATGQNEGLAARLLMTRGSVALVRGAHEAARADLEAAARRAEQAGDREAAWQALSRLAETCWAAGDRPETLQALAAAVEQIDRVAGELPDSLKALYEDAPGRRAVREALRRVRAGMPPRAPTEDAEAAVVPRRTAGYRERWARRYPDIVGRASALYSVFNTLDRVSGSDSMVLVRGESGTGKELVASALHEHSPRAAKPFVKVNCSAFVETLLLSELFGHEKGAFTGAVSSKKGRFELADGGTLFLDEIGDISPNTQVALLRVLQEGAFERVGGQETLQVDVRVICATHRNLERMVDAGTFRADLYYRLRGVIIELPPLRERRTDIPALVEHFLARRPNARTRPLRFSQAALASLVQHDWPGNVRELENVVRSVALFADGGLVDLSELAELGDIFHAPGDAALLAISEMLTAPPQPSEPEPEAAPADVSAAPDGLGVALPEGAEPSWDGGWLETLLEEAGTLSDLKKRIEFEAISRALRAEDGNITRAAERLGMKRPRLSQIIHATPELETLKREVAGK